MKMKLNMNKLVAVTLSVGFVILTTLNGIAQEQKDPFKKEQSGKTETAVQPQLLPDSNTNEPKRVLDKACPIKSDTYKWFMNVYKSHNLSFYYYKDSASGNREIIKTVSDENEVRQLIEEGVAPNLLHLSFEGINGNDLIHLRNLTNIDSLFLQNIKGDGKSFEALKYFHKLNVLRLKGTNVTDDTLKYYLSHISLRTIELMSTKVSGKGLDSMVHKESIVCVSLHDHEHFSDSDLKALESFKSLMIFSIYNSPVSDDGVKYLKYFKNIDRFEIHGTKITQNGLQILKNIYPNCRIYYN